MTDGENTTRLFVYGTLKPGCTNYFRIEHVVQSSCPASTEGILIDLGAYPALVPGQGRVRGILLDLEVEALVITDRIEGYQRDSGHNLFIRTESIVRLEDGQEITAWIYEFANPERIADLPKPTVGCTDDITVYRWPVPNAPPPDS